jgi:hypothetical protein
MVWYISPLKSAAGTNFVFIQGSKRFEDQQELHLDMALPAKVFKDAVQYLHHAIIAYMHGKEIYLGYGVRSSRRGP